LTTRTPTKKRRKLQPHLKQGSHNNNLLNKDKIAKQNEEQDHIKDFGDWVDSLKIAKSVAKRKLSIGQWLPRGLDNSNGVIATQLEKAGVRKNEGLAEVISGQERGPAVQTMGFNCSEFVGRIVSHYYRPEEAVYLVDQCLLQITEHGVPLSIQQAFGLLSATEFGLPNYLAFAHLSRLGFIVHRTTIYTTRSDTPLNKQNKYNNNNDNTPSSSSSFASLPSSSLSSSSPARKKKEMSAKDQQITFDVWKPAKKRFKRKGGTTPDFRLCVCNYSDPLPSVDNLQHLIQLSCPVPVKFAIVDGSTVTFSSFQLLTNEIEG
jgi:hypothetical protein